MSWAAPAVPGLGRSLTLLRLFLVLSAVILAAGAVALSGALSRTIEREAVEDEKQDVTLFANAVLSPVLVRDGEIVVDLASLATLASRLALPDNVLSVKIWKPDGTLAFATLAPERIGKAFPLDDHLGAVLRDGEPVGELEALEPTGHTAAESALLDLERVLEVYAPIRNARGETVGAYEVYLDPADVEASIAAVTRRIWIAVIAVFAVLYVLLALLVGNASRRLQAQNAELAQRSRALLESVAHLERSSMEMVEALNATVEAKDPYTAGHSQRVREIALAIGGRLGLAEHELATLGVAALFHDVGKIAVPDAILTKPARLTPAEMEVMREHAARGAEIVARLSDLADAVPAVRHHHERWDGSGYPEGLIGDEIPEPATIVGLADAWDAMTTERPYASALSLNAALAEVVGGRGAQFSPRVVDAFLEVVRHQPDAVRPALRDTVAAAG